MAALAVVAVATFGAGAAHAAGGEYTTSVVGGTTDQRADNPWVVAILDPGRGTRFQRQYCGGSLVTRRYVLTAAHCLQRRMEVLVGTKNLNTGGRVVKVATRHRHPYGDLALLRLDRTVSQAPIRLVGSGVHYVGRPGYIAGWGSLSGSNTYPSRLQSAFVPIRSDPTCEAVFDGFDGSIEVCAGDGYPDACMGDSGGPLARKANGAWRLVGVTSAGSATCNRPGVYAWVGSPILRRWLRNQLGI